ncbi:unnamed protein product [Polarella glacialis]|uniref:ADP-ribosyl-[dinitrogen reductase] hydrolase n=2 Tax=Polarella glacialis TaxID=89957 RepID=A0A813GMN4_POLGL|nr:unnamed protein product [Polarella glacialis]
MALWALWHSTSFSSCIQHVVNLLGDADTTAAIAGQMAGALYGWQDLAGSEWGGVCLANLSRWDPLAEVGLRAALLYHHGPAVDVKLVQAEGFPAVRVFAEPVAGSEMVGEVPSGEHALVLNMQSNFCRVSWQSVTGPAVIGWVGVKNTVALPPNQVRKASPEEADIISAASRGSMPGSVHSETSPSRVAKDGYST